MAVDPKLTKMSYSFHTTNEDKDCNTRVGAQVLLNNHAVAERFDFNHDKNADHWGNESDQGPWDLPLSEHPTKGELNQAVYRISTQAAGGAGNDEWHFDAHLHAEFEDGSQRNWTFLKGNLNSTHGSTAVQDFGLGGGHD
jgi:hypothetical protein